MERNNFIGAGHYPGDNRHFLMNQERTHEVARPFMWCVVCERAFVGEKAVAAASKGCPCKGCRSDSPHDIWPWSLIREFYPDFPEVPVLGERYLIIRPRQFARYTSRRARLERWAMRSEN